MKILTAEEGLYQITGFFLLESDTASKINQVIEDFSKHMAMRIKHENPEEMMTIFSGMAYLGYLYAKEEMK